MSDVNAASRSKIVLGGDFIFDKKVSTQLTQKGNILRLFPKEVEVILKSGDVFCFNFEGVMSRGGAARPKALPSTFSFRVDPAVLDFIDDLGIPVFSLANNHVMDFGLESFEEMLAALKARSVHYIGAGKRKDEALSPLIIPCGSLKIAFLAYTDLLLKQYYASGTQGGVAELTSENIEQGIREARAQGADHIIVSLHTVKELNSSFTALPDALQKKWYRKAVELGADIVFGHQPHGLQTWERYRQGLIIYSLGALIYNPQLGDHFPEGHTFHKSTQLHGGGLAVIQLGKHGIQNVAIQPTKSVIRDGSVRLVLDTSFKWGTNKKASQ